MTHPGHPLRYTKGNEELDRKRKAVLPTPHEVAIMRRAAGGFIIVTMVDGSPRYSYEDGSPVGFIESTKENHPGQRQFSRMVNEGWLVGDRGDSLFEDQPQIYRARPNK